MNILSFECTFARQNPEYTMKSLLAFVFFVFANAAFAADEPSATPATINFFNPATWMQMSQQGHAAAQPGAANTGAAFAGTFMPGAGPQGPTMAFNPFHPAGWAAFVSPQTHEQAHMAFLNPANYTQFMQPQFYMQAMHPNNFMAWMNPASYAAFMNPATWNYWMNPAAYMHMMNSAQYLQAMNPNAYAPFMNPALYMQWMQPAAYAVPAATNMTPGFNMFDPSAWAKVFNAKPTDAAPEARANEQK